METDYNKMAQQISRAAEVASKPVKKFAYFQAQLFIVRLDLADG